MLWVSTISIKLMFIYVLHTDDCITLGREILDYDVKEISWLDYQFALDCWSSVSAGGFWKHRGGLRLLWPEEQQQRLCNESKAIYHSPARCSDLGPRLEQLSYSWEPSLFCPIPKPAIKDYSQSLCGKDTGDILIVGDSLSQEFDMTLLNALKNCNRYIQCAGEEPGFKVLMARNDYLEISGAQRGQHSKYQVPFYNEIILQDKSIKAIIFNRGAHFEPSVNYTSNLEFLFSSLQKDRPDINVYFRNTPPGHAFCATESKMPPLAKPRTENRTMYQRRAGDTNPYHWSEFVVQNLLAQEIAARYRVTYLDVASATELRPDSHLSAQDCLHYCIPGPIDMWVELFVWAVHLRERLVSYLTCSTCDIQWRPYSRNGILSHL